MKIEKINQTKISGVFTHTELKLLIALEIAKKSGMHQMTVHSGLDIEYEPGNDVNFGRLVYSVSIDHNEAKEN